MSHPHPLLGAGLRPNPLGSGQVKAHPWPITDRQGGDQEGDLPAGKAARRVTIWVKPVPPLRHHAAQRHRQAEADGQAHGQARHANAATALGQGVEDDRVGGRLRCPFADPHAQSADRQQGKATGKGRKAGKERPEGEADRQQLGADPSVHQPPQGKREQRVEQREDRTVKQADLGITDVQVGADIVGEDGEDLPVQQAHRLRGGNQCQRIPAITADLLALCQGVGCFACHDPLLSLSPPRL